MGRLLFLCPEKKGARPFPLFLRAGKRVIWGAPLPGRKKAPCALPFAPCGGARLRPFGGGTHCPLEKNAPDRPGFAPPKKGTPQRPFEGGVFKA